MAEACKCGKRYYTKATARMLAARLARRDDGMPGSTWNAYKCPFSRSIWHLGHVPAAVPATREGRREMVRRGGTP